MGKKHQQQPAGKEFWHATLDPRNIRFAHSRIRPVFSGCGRRVEDTLEDIRQGKTSVAALPTITVIEGPPIEKDRNQNWYFSLNNRRLWVFKACREEGLLEVIKVRVRSLKSNEVERYTVERCSLSAKFMREKTPSLVAEGAPPLEVKEKGDLG